MLAEETKIGKKGEILAKKKLRLRAGLQPGDRIIIEARDGQLLIRKILTVEEALALPTIMTGSPEELEQAIADEMKKQGVDLS